MTLLEINKCIFVSKDYLINILELKIPDNIIIKSIVFSKTHTLSCTEIKDINNNLIESFTCKSSKRINTLLNKYKSNISYYIDVLYILPVKLLNPNIIYTYDIDTFIHNSYEKLIDISTTYNYLDKEELINLIVNSKALLLNIDKITSLQYRMLILDVINKLNY